MTSMLGMSLETSDVKNLIESEIRDAEASVREEFHPGEMDAGQHFEVEVVSPEFRDLNRVQQHKRIHEALDEYMGDEIHSVEIDTDIP